MSNESVLNHPTLGEIRVGDSLRFIYPTRGGYTENSTYKVCRVFPDTRGWEICVQLEDNFGHSGSWTAKGLGEQFESLRSKPTEPVDPRILRDEVIAIDAEVEQLRAKLAALAIKRADAVAALAREGFALAEKQPGA